MTSEVAGRKHDLNFETDGVGVRCDDCPAVLTNCLESDRESKACAVGCPWIATRFFYTKEWLEDLLQQLSRNARTVIADRKNGLRRLTHFLGFPSHFHFAPWRSEPYRIA